jgi:histidinol-phosphate phosphatase family protein
VVDVFVDRDGVINRNRPDHVKSWSDFEFLPGSVEALARLTRHGHRTFIITNQAIVNKGVVAPEVVDSINRRMVEEVARNGGSVEAVLLCPHMPGEGCGCRKPMPGLLLKAAQTLGAVLGERQRCWVARDLSQAVEFIEANGRRGSATPPQPYGAVGSESLAASHPRRRRVVPRLQ